MLSLAQLSPSLYDFFIEGIGGFFEGTPLFYSVMNKECFKGVLRVFQGSFKDFTNCVLRKFQRCFRGPSRVFQGNLKFKGGLNSFYHVSKLF